MHVDVVAVEVGADPLIERLAHHAATVHEAVPPVPAPHVRQGDFYLQGWREASDDYTPLT